MALKFEIRDEQGELVYSGGRPVTANLTALVEREIVRRQIAFLSMVRESWEKHAEEQDAAARSTEDALLEQFQVETWQAKLDHADQLDDIAELMEGMKVEPSRWHPVQRRRERKFSERVDGVVKEMLLLTRRGNG